MTNTENPDALKLLDFWLGAGPPRWYAKSDDFDAACAKWAPLLERARDGACDGWMATAAGSLALTILLDQIPRNTFRGSARQFDSDAKAVSVAQTAVAGGHDKSTLLPVRLFYYLPFEHAEDVALQEKALDLIRPLKNQDAYYWALVHADAIRRFGRFPHRNAVLGRETTEAERAYLQSGGFGS